MYDRPVERESAECFERALATLDGVCVPLSGVGSKMLRYMLDAPEGCDAWITRDRFVVQYGWHLAHHRYGSDVAPEITSWLVRELDACRGVLPAGRVFARDGYPHAWRYGPRAVWIAATTDKITIQIREAISPELPAEPPPPIEPPIEYVAATRPCPSCRHTPDRYRKLRDGGLVCLACGASSADPAHAPR